MVFVNMKFLLKAAPLVVMLLAGCATTGGVEEDPEALQAAAEAEAAQLMAGGDGAARSGRLNDALGLYARAIAQAPSADLWLRVGAVHQRLHNDSEAAIAYRTALQLDPEDARAYEELGLIYVAQENEELARAHLTKAIALDDQRWRSYNGLGVLADLDHDYEVAIASYRRALEIRPESAMLMNNIGYSHYLAGSIEVAKELFIQALTINGHFKPARFNLGLLYARLGEYEDAISVLADVMDAPAAYNDVGYVALRNADYAGAERLLEEAVRLSPVYFDSAHKNLELARTKLQQEGG